MKRRAVLRESVVVGFNVLKKKGGLALDAVEAAIRVLEDSRVFNAGAGACLTLEGKISADASIMKGDLSCGSIGDSNVARNPISLARQVMDKSDHVLIVGSESLRKFSEATGFKTSELAPTDARINQYHQNLRAMKAGSVETWPRNFALIKKYLTAIKAEPANSDTIGAVAIDQESNVCSGVSTGGRWLKLPGRVGDSAVVGAGLYADNSAGAACATGAGEDIIRVCLCKTVCDLMRIGADAQAACDAAISMLTDSRGDGLAGVIAVDRLGRFGSARNTEILQRAFRFNSMKGPHVAIRPHEVDPRSGDRHDRKRLWF